MKKLLSLCVLLLAAVSVWADNVEVDGIRYYIYWNGATNNYAEVLKPESGVYDGAITIPDHVTYKEVDVPVVTIRNEAFSGATITSITLPSSLKEIGQKAFYNCASLTSITLPESLEKILSQAFSGTALTEVAIPGNVRTISSAFRNIPTLTKLTLAHTDTFTDGESWTYGEGVMRSDGSAFDGSPITDLIIDRKWSPNSYPNEAPVTTAKNITLGSHLTAVPARLAKNLALEKLVVGAGITEVGEYAFNKCTFPAGTSIPFAQIKKIGDHAFEECAGIPATLDLSAVEEIGSEAFQKCTSIESLTIGGGTIGYYAFNGCSNITSITLKEGVTEIGSSNFKNLANLTTVSIPSTMKVIGNEAFYNCENLTIPSGLPEGLEEIGLRTFYHCKKLNVKIPSTVTKIEQSAFSSCESLTEITIPKGVTSLNMSTFSGCDGVKKLVVPGTLNRTGSYDFDCPNLEELTLEYSEENAEVLSMDDTTFGLNPQNLKKVYIDRPFKWRSNRNSQFGKAENIEFGPHVTAIPDNALSDMTNMKSVTMSDNVKSIGEKAFYRAKAETLQVSKKLESIGRMAFMAYTFTDGSFTIPFTVTEIGEAAFGQFRSWGNTLKNVYVAWLTPLEIEDNEPEEDNYGANTRFAYTDDQTLWVPGGTMDLYKAAPIWKKFKNFDYWSFVVNASVTGKGSLKISNGEAVTDNGTNTQLTAKADAPAKGLFVREKDLTFTPVGERGYGVKTFTANGAAIAATDGVYKVANLLADQTVAATFAAINYTLTYDLAGGALAEGVSNPATYTVESAAIKLNNPSRTGYEFTGWTGTDLETATMEVTIPASSIGNRKYTATWKAITYKITYDAAGGTLATGNPTEYTAESNAITLKAPTRKGYTFKGWTGTGLTQATMEVTIAKGSTGDRQYTATWTANTYKVSFQANNGKGEMADQAFVYDKEQALTQNAFTRDGYAYTGWNTQADGKGTPYKDKETVKNLTDAQDGVVKLYAQWTMVASATNIARLVKLISEGKYDADVDVNGDKKLNIADVIIMVNEIKK